MKIAIDTLVKRLNGLAPRIAIVLGSGLSGIADHLAGSVTIPFSA